MFYKNKKGGIIIRKILQNLQLILSTQLILTVLAASISIASKSELYTPVKVICIINFPTFIILGINSITNPKLVIELTTKKMLTSKNILYQKIKGVIILAIGIVFIGIILN